jgi:deazaflavin-dependent oxidoreductase (nitroreductase family)
MGSDRRRSLKRRLNRAVETRVVNPVVRRLLARGRLGGTYAILETTGRKSGQARRTPVANGLQGDTFWLLCAYGDRAHYARNIAADPHVRIGVVEGLSLRWRAGVAVPLPDDDARARQRELGRGRLGYKLDAVLMRAVATDLMTIRVDLER